MACSCRGDGAVYVVTTHAGNKVDARTEDEAKMLALATQGTYAKK